MLAIKLPLTNDGLPGHISNWHFMPTAVMNLSSWRKAFSEIHVRFERETIPFF